MSDTTSSIDRRGFLRLAAVGAAAAGSIPILSACGSSGGSGGGTGSLTIQTFPTGLTPTQNVLKIYKQQYGRSASTVTVSGDYYTVTETRLLGGNPPFTTLDFDPGYLSSFAEKGWITDLEGLPGISQMKADMYPSVIKSLTGPDGKLYALPQYTNIYGFFYNEQILAKYGLKPVSDWGSMLDQGAFLKKKGYDTPVVPVWSTQFDLTNATFVAECVSRGMSSQFDESLDPLWDKNPAALDVLNFWKELLSQKLVPPDAVTIDFNQASSVMQAGKSAYFWFNSYQLQTLNNKKESSAAGNIRLGLMPGSTHETSTFTAPTFQTKRAASKEEAWTLTSFASGLDKDGKYTGPIQREAIGSGVLLGYKSTAKDPTIKRAWGTWANSDDLDMMATQQRLAQGAGPVLNTTWYPTYNDYMTKALSSFLAGQTSASQTLQQTAQYVRGLKKPS